MSILTRILKKAAKDADDMDKGIAALGSEAEADVSYRMQHQPTPPDSAARLDDMTGGGEVFPDDIYSAQGLRYYGSGSPADKESFQIIQSVRGEPEAEIMIYRAVPKGVNTINEGDFVSISRKYAEDHASYGYGDMGDEAGDVISMKVKVKDVFSDGNDLNEFGYFPSSSSARSGPESKESANILKARGGAVNIDDEDIFEPTMEMLRRENRPQRPEVMVEQPMFGGPMERMRSIQGDGNTKNVVDIVGSRGTDQVFRQLMSSPNFRAYIEVEDIPPATLAESKRVFDYLVKERSINDAVKYLFETFGQAPKSDLPIRESLGVSPIEQRITTYNESVMSSGDPMDRGINALR